MPLAALVPVAIALIALLLIYGLVQLGRVLAQIFPSSIGIGPASIHPRAWVQAGVDALASIVHWIIGDVIRPLISLILAPVRSLLHWVTQMAGFAATTAEAIEWLVQHGIPQLAGRLTHLIASRVAAAEAYAARLARDAEAYAARLARDVHAYALRVYHAAVAVALAAVRDVRAYALTLHRWAEAYALRLAHGAEAYAASLVRAARAELGRAIDDVRKIARAEITTAEKYADTIVRDATKALQTTIAASAAAVIQTVDVDAVKPLEAVWGGLLTDVDGLADVIAGDFADIGAAVRAIPRAVPLDLTDAIPAIETLAIPALRFLRDCGVPNCRNLSKIGRDLQQLFGALEGATFLALLAELITDPKGMAGEVQSVLGPVADTAASAARNLLGV